MTGDSAPAPTVAALSAALVAQAHQRLVDEGLLRLDKCLANLTEQEIWHRPNENTVSIGNLLLHLAGNVRQWVCAGIGGQPDIRQRPLEFSETGPIPAQQLMTNLRKAVEDALRVLDGFDPAQWLSLRKVQIYERTPLSILIHVIEHFSYHVGQVTYAVKTRKNLDLAYYGKQNLNQSKPPQ